jgi:RNA polymerase sigma-70 factor, ECF subfamily
MEHVERELIKSLHSGDQRAYGMLIRLYFQPLTIYAKSITLDSEQAKDIVQEVFVKIWNARNSLDVRSSLKSYLYRMTHNACIDQLRKDKSRSSTKSVSYDDSQHRMQAFEIQDQEIFFDLMFSEELEVLLQNAIDQLPGQCREIFILCRYEQLSYQEISQKLTISLSTVKTQMVRAMKKLHESMKIFIRE